MFGFHPTLSCHGNIHSSLDLLIWLVENVEMLKSPRNINLPLRQCTKKAVWPSPLSESDDSDGHTAFCKNCSTALAARSRQGREHAVNAVALIEEDPRDGNSAVSGGHMTDRPKSDGVTAEHSCPVRRVRMSAVYFTKGERECPWAAGSVVGLAFHKGHNLSPLPP